MIDAYTTLHHKSYKHVNVYTSVILAKNSFFATLRAMFEEYGNYIIASYAITAAALIALTLFSYIKLSVTRKKLSRSKELSAREG